MNFILEFAMMDFLTWWVKMLPRFHGLLVFCLARYDDFFRESHGSNFRNGLLFCS